jgi:hypothetical protein
MWDEMRIGASLVPIPTGKAVEIYHGADRANRYGMGAMLLDGDDPARCLPGPHDRSPPKSPTSTTGSCRTSCSRAGTSTSATVGSVVLRRGRRVHLRGRPGDRRRAVVLTPV